MGINALSKFGDCGAKKWSNRCLQPFEFLCHSILRTVACILLESRLLGGQVFLRYQQEAPFLLATQGLGHSWLHNPIRHHCSRMLTIPLASHPLGAFSGILHAWHVYDNNTTSTANKRQWEIPPAYKRQHNLPNKIQKSWRCLDFQTSTPTEQHNKWHQKKARKEVKEDSTSSTQK